MIKPFVFIVLLGSYHLICAQTGVGRALSNGIEKFQEEVMEAKEITEYYEEKNALPEFVYVHPNDPPELENPHDYTFLHRPIPSTAKAIPVDVRTNSVLIEGVTTGVKCKVPPLSDADRIKYKEWMFFDGFKEEFGSDRPVMDFSKYPAGDAPAADFPINSWQTDSTYILHFLDNAQKLIDRSREAIYEEYGFPVNGPSDERTKTFGFKKGQDRIDLTKLGVPLVATETEFAGLVRRLLHAMMTNQEFKVVLNGHSVAAGHDSNFWQSYIHQFHHVMEPIFTRLGMKLSTYNYGRGGLGTLQDTMAGTDTLGDPDVLMWDSSMTEKSTFAVDAFFRQAIMSGTRVPFFIRPQFGNYPGEIAYINAAGQEKNLQMTPMDEEKRNDIPYAVQYMKCEASEMSCNKPARKFNRGCWDDSITDYEPTEQKTPPFGGQHPSWRSYQIMGRNIALLFLHALEEAVVLWQDNSVTGGQFPLDDEHWHLTDHFNKIRNQTQESAAESHCMEGPETLRKICTVPMRGRTEFTGRANPNRSALRNLVRPTADGHVPSNLKKVVYDKPITFEWQKIPEGHVDVRAIVGAGGFDGRRLSEEDGTGLQRRLGGGNSQTLETVDRVGSEAGVMPNVVHDRSNLRSLQTTGIVPGNGWQLQESVPAGYCDGSTDYHSCKRDKTNTCLAYDHHDTRTGIFGDHLSGWIVFDIDNVVEGFVVVKFEAFHKGKVNPRTEGWTTVNNVREGDTRRLQLPHWAKDIEIDVAVDGVINTYNFEMLEDKVMKVERVVQIMVLHDEKPQKPKDMEIAMRVRCTEAESKSKHLCNINISHLYWA